MIKVFLGGLLPQGGSTSHINPSFFPQGGGGPPMQQSHIGPPLQGPPQNSIAPPHEYRPPSQQRMHPVSLTYLIYNH